MYIIEKYKKLGYRGYFDEAGPKMTPKYIAGFTPKEVKSKLAQRINSAIYELARIKLELRGENKKTIENLFDVGIKVE